MKIFDGLKTRHLEMEMMDDPSLDPARHAQALRGLERINRWSASVRIVWPSIQALAREIQPKPLKVLDIATGAGDLPIGLWRRGARSGFTLEIAGCDKSSVAVEHARQQAKRAAATVNFFELDALTGEIPSGYDLILCSLFLHHLSSDEALQLLRAMTQKAGRGILVNDLARSRTGLMLAYCGSRLLSQSKVVHADAPQSVRAACTMEEVEALAKQAGLSGFSVESRWPCRFLLTWRKP